MRHSRHPSVAQETETLYRLPSRATNPTSVQNFFEADLNIRIIRQSWLFLYDDSIFEMVLSTAVRQSREDGYFLSPYVLVGHAWFYTSNIFTRGLWKKQRAEGKGAGGGGGVMF